MKIRPVTYGWRVQDIIKNIGWWAGFSRVP